MPNLDFYLKNSDKEFMGAIDWIIANYPDGIPKNALINLNKNLTEEKISEYGSIRTTKVPSLSEYLDLLYSASRNYSLYVYGCILIALRKCVTIETADIIKMSVEDTRKFNNIKIPRWLKQVIDYHIRENCKGEDPFLFVKTKNGKRYLNEKDIFMLNRSMFALSSIEPWKFAEMSGLWGREVGIFHKAYLPPSMNKKNYLDNLGKIAFVYSPQRLACFVLEFLGDSFLIYTENDEFLIASMHTIMSFGNARHHYKTRLLDYVDDKNYINEEWYEKYYRRD